MSYRSTVTSKEDGQVGSFEYVWVDGKLISIVFVSDGSTSTAKYIYNDFDEPVGMIVTGAEGTVSNYYYLKNAQGDITNIVSSSGGKMVEFTYDVFGNQTAHYQSDPSTMVGMVYWAEQVIVHALTPFGYRGYCYDTYSGLYYLQSRYYDPQTGRFINADDTNYLNATGTVLGCNLFAYCENDAVNGVDPSGYYNANEAVAYAKKWTGGVNNQPDAVFHNKLYKFFPNGDCMNFVSQCLSAGGLNMNNTWYSYRYDIYFLWKWRYYYAVSDAWCKVSKFNTYFYNSNKWSRWFTFYQSSNTTTADARRNFLKYYDLVTLGAVILMDFKFDGKTEYTHAALVVRVSLNDIKYAAHTSNRWWQSLWKNVESKKIERYIIYNIGPNAS